MSNQTGTITSNATATINVLPGETYVWAVAGTWASATVTLKWYDGTTAVTIQASTADDDLEVTFPVGKAQIVSSGGGTALSLKWSLTRKQR